MKGKQLYLHKRLLTIREKMLDYKLRNAAANDEYIRMQRELDKILMEIFSME